MRGMSVAVLPVEPTGPNARPTSEESAMIRRALVLLATAIAIGGCHDDPVAVGDVTPPAAPRGFYSVTGDHTVYLNWLGNTESDVAGYNVRVSDCANGPACPYNLVGSTTSNSFTVTGLPNGVRKYFAIEAYDYAGNISDLTYEDVNDTPRPEGFAQALNNYLEASPGSGWDFSAFATRTHDDPSADMFFGDNGSVTLMFVPDLSTDIQDAGYTASLDDVDFSPTTGWASSGSVELIQGHSYIVWTRDDHYAKFRVTDIVPAGPSTPKRVIFDWAYQVATGNRELRNRPVRPSGPRPIHWPDPA